MEERIYYWDNAKFILIVFVIASHLMGGVKAVSPTATDIWNFLYLFHMPAFIMIAGHFTAGQKQNQKAAIRICFYWVLYVFSCVILFLIDFVFGFNRNSTWFLNPVSATWFLQAMAVWCIMTPVLQQLKTKVLIVVSVLLGLLIGLDIYAGNYASISRIVTMLPFFVIGLKFDLDVLRAYSRRTSWKLAAVIIFIGTYFLMSNYRDVIVGNVLRGIAAYEKMGFNNLWVGIGYRLLWYMVALMVIIAFLVLIPDRKVFFSDHGQYTLQIYLYHMPIYEIAGRGGYTLIMASWGFLEKYSFWLFQLRLHLF